MELNRSTGLSKFCRTCLQPISNDLFHSLDSKEPSQEITTARKLSKCIPQLNLNIIPDAVICNECFIAFDFTYKFRNRCLQAEEQLEKYLRLTFTPACFQKYVQSMQEPPLDMKVIDDEKPPDVEFVDASSINDSVKIEPADEAVIVEHIYAKGKTKNNVNEDNHEELVKNHHQTFRKRTIDEYFQCYSCGRIYSTKTALVDHLSSCKLDKKNSVAKIIPNSNPKAKLDKKNNIAKIIRIIPNSNLKAKIIPNNKPKPYKCSLCLVSFSSENNLMVHMKRHMPLNCYVCGIPVASRVDLLGHMKTHEVNKLFKCSKCPFSTKFKHNLVVHERIHTGEKPFKCLQCNYSTNHSSHLTIHKRRHVGEHRYQCTHCDYTTMDVTNMNVHKKTHLAEKMLKCTECDYSCSAMISLQAHMKEHNTVWL